MSKKKNWSSKLCRTYHSCDHNYAIIDEVGSGFGSDLISSLISVKSGWAKFTIGRDCMVNENTIANVTKVVIDYSPETVEGFIGKITHLQWSHYLQTNSINISHDCPPTAVEMDLITDFRDNMTSTAYAAPDLTVGLYRGDDPSETVKSYQRVLFHNPVVTVDIPKVNVHGQVTVSIKGPAVVIPYKVDVVNQPDITDDSDHRNET